MYKIENWLPVFPGFYNTIFESDEESEIYEINVIRSGKGWDEISYEDCEWDYEEYNERVAESCGSFINDKLVALGFVSKVEFEELVSPGQYNFSNDSIDVVYHMTDENISKLHKYLVENSGEFEGYLCERYTGRDGFIPYYSNDISDWLTPTFKEDILECKHKLGSILQFVCDMEEIGQDEMWEEADTYISCLNYSELTENEEIGEVE
jgi:hypothetical protein